MDFQNDLVHPEGAFRHWGIPYRVAERRVIERTAELVTAARESAVPVVFTTYVVRPELPERGQVRFYRLIHESGALRAGTWGGQIHAALTPESGEIVVAKWRPNPFWQTELDVVLRAWAVETLVLTGIVTEWVVEEAARHAAAAGFGVSVAADCCESARDDFRDHALRRILPQIATVTTSADVIEEWRSGGQNRPAGG